MKQKSQLISNSQSKNINFQNTDKTVDNNIAHRNNILKQSIKKLNGLKDKNNVLYIYFSCT